MKQLLAIILLCIPILLLATPEPLPDEVDISTETLNSDELEFDNSITVGGQEALVQESCHELSTFSTVTTSASEKQYQQTDNSQSVDNKAYLTFITKEPDKPGGESNNLHLLE